MIVGLFAAIFGLSVLMACGGSSGGSTPPPPAAAILVQPAGLTVNAGQTATFTVTVSNAVSYQWQKLAFGATTPVNISGATSASYTTPATTPGMNGEQYSVIVTGPNGAPVCSLNALLTVNWFSYTSQPQDFTVQDGGSGTISATESANPNNATHQWQRQDPGSSTFVDVPGETAATLTRASVRYATDNGAQFRRKDVHAATGTYFSNAATLTVAAIAPAITLQPQDVTVNPGQQASFTVAASGTQGTWQWYKTLTDVASAASISGATADTYQCTPSEVAASGTKFFARYTNPLGHVDSHLAVMTVVPAPVAPTITLQPQDQTVHVGQSATFTIDATGLPSPTFQWRKGGVAISGATSKTYTTPGTTLSDDGTLFSCYVSNTQGNVTSRDAKLNVSAALVAPWFTTQPSNQTVLVGANVTFSWTAGGNPTPTGVIQEYIGTTWTTLTTGFSLTLNNVQLTDSGRKFQCIATNSEGPATSNPVTLTVNPAILTISGNAGIANATLTYTGGSTTADGTGAYSFTVAYNWSGTVTPSLAGYTFSPVNKTYTNVVASQTAQNYTATSSGPVTPDDLVVSMTAASDSGQYNNDAITASDPVYTITIGANTTDVQMNVDSTGWTSIGLVTSKTISGLADGTHTVQFQAMNGSTTSAHSTDKIVTILTSAPGKSSENFPNLDTNGASGSGTITFTQAIPAGYGVVSTTFVDANTGNPLGGTATATADGTATVSVSYTAPNYSGDVKIRFVVRNIAGVQVTIDSNTYTLF